MIEVTSNSHDNIVTATARGTVSREDYERIFIPAIEEKLKHHDKIRLLYQLGPDFSQYTVAAILDDAKLGISHLTSFEKVAIVTDVHWVSDASRFFGLFIPCPVRAYANAKLTEAKAWLADGQ